MSRPAYHLARKLTSMLTLTSINIYIYICQTMRGVHVYGAACAVHAGRDTVFVWHARAVVR